jgi:sugar phosphate permease
MVDTAIPALDATKPESDFSLRKIRIATVALLGMTFATSLLPFGALAYVLKPMTEEFHWTREQFGYANSMLMIFGSLTVFPMGIITDKVAARPIILLGTLGVGVVTLLVSRITSLWQFYLLFALLGVFGSSGASYSKVIASLFTQNRGKAMAIFGVEGTGVRAIIPMATIFLLLNYHWRGMFFAFGVLIFLIWPIVYFGLEEPGTIGRLPKLRLGAKRAPAAAAPAPPRMDFEGKTMVEVIMDGAFWAMLGGSLVSMVIMNGLMTNTIAAIEDKGFSQTTAAAAMSVATFVGIGGTLLGGYMMDKFNTVKIAIPFSLCTAIGYFLLMTVTPKFGGQPMLFAAAGFGMFAMAAHLPMVGYFFTRFFGLKSFAAISGFQSFVQALCMGFFAPMVGRIYDQTGNYDLAFKIGIGAALLSASIYLFLPRYRFSANIGAMPAPQKPPPAKAHPTPVPAE